MAFWIGFAYVILSFFSPLGEHGDALANGGKAYVSEEKAENRILARTD